MDDHDPEARRRMWQELDNGWATTIELMTAVGVWMGIGWLLDTWLGTSPWLMAAGAFLGFALGMYLAYVRHQHRLAQFAPRPVQVPGPRRGRSSRVNRPPAPSVTSPSRDPRA